MSSEIQNSSSVMRSPAQAVALPQAQTTPVPAQPKVTAPKPVQMEFNEAQNRENLRQAVKDLNDQMFASKIGLGFSIDESLNLPVVTVRNSQTGEVVRQIPSEAVVNVAHSIDQLKGLLLNSRI